MVALAVEHLALAAFDVSLDETHARQAKLVELAGLSRSIVTGSGLVVPGAPTDVGVTLLRYSDLLTATDFLRSLPIAAMAFKFASSSRTVRPRKAP